MRATTIAIHAAVLLLGVAVLPPTASADPEAWSCGDTRSYEWFNGRFVNPMDNDNACAPHAGRSKEDLIIVLRNSTDMWIQVAGDGGENMKMAMYASRANKCASPVAASSSSPAWGASFDVGFRADAYVNYYVAFEELDDRGITGGWGFDITKVACCPDNDGDGAYAFNSACGGMPSSLRDCNDSDGLNAPGRPEVCDGRDNNCDVNNLIDEGLTVQTYYRDADGDGYGTASNFREYCAQPDGYVTNRADCDDGEANAYPGRTEVCDGIDNDCDGQIDERLLHTYYRDLDSDLYGDSTSPTQACSQPRGYRTSGGDCDDGDAARYPGNPEFCDSKDNDCNGLIDDGAGTPWFRDADGDGHGNSSSAQVACQPPVGFVSTSDDCDDGDSRRHPDLPEICDNKDNDCNLIVDDGVGGLWYRDDDGDGRGNPLTEQQACTNPGGRVITSDDCDDTNPNRSPLLEEVCDGIDNDCDLVVDDGVGPTWFRDADGDGHGDAARQRQACSEPPGYLANSDDCDDYDADRYPGLPETCDNKDNDCNLIVDDNPTDAPSWYADNDSDGFGDPSNTTRSCVVPGGHVANDEDCNDRSASVNPEAVEIPYDNIDQDCVGGDLCDADGDGEAANIGLCGGADCADGDPNIYPGAIEVIDNVDNNCNGAIDEDSNAYDDDRDGWTEEAGDCDDTDATVFPGAREVCSGTDNDCDGWVDEHTLCSDDDGDGSSEDDGDCNDANGLIGPDVDEVPGNGIDDNCDGIVDAGSFDADADGVTEEAGDCDDHDATAHPGAVEVADGVDNDCDGEIDEGTTAADDDLDGFSEDEGDCDDANPDIHPDAVEIANGRDDDCNGITDDQGPDWDDDGDGLTDNEGDCDDGDSAVRPGATERPNGIDDDCDGVVDEGISDLDRDGWTVEDGDCDDADGWVFPGAVEMCDFTDNNCDGTIDEGCDGEGIDTDVGELAEPRCGCQSAPTPWTLTALLLAIPFIRRRRS